MRFLRSILSPEVYHGAANKPPFFEGWYFKVVDASTRHRYAFIPGVFLHVDPEKQHAFVQVLDGVTGSSTFHRFLFEDFTAERDRFHVGIRENHFQSGQFHLALHNSTQQIDGTLHFVSTTPWPVSLLSPGIMGWYAWVPFMECYHGVLSLDHEIQGALQINGTKIDFSGGRGYIEKDWGRSFPSAHIWMQTNHFSETGTSLTASVAIIPWIGYSFPGFIVGFLHRGTLHRFATYTGATILNLELTDTTIHWTMTNREHELQLVATRSHGGLLHAPTVTEMTHRLLESLSATVDVTLTTKRGEVIFQGSGNHAGLEVGGMTDDLVALWQKTAR